MVHTKHGNGDDTGVYHSMINDLKSLLEALFSIGFHALPLIWNNINHHPKPCCSKGIAKGIYTHLGRYNAFFLISGEGIFQFSILGAHMEVFYLNDKSDRHRPIMQVAEHLQNEMGLPP